MWHSPSQSLSLYICVCVWGVGGVVALHRYMLSCELIDDGLHIVLYASFFQPRQSNIKVVLQHHLPFLSFMNTWRLECSMNAKQIYVSITYYWWKIGNHVSKRRQRYEKSKWDEKELWIIATCWRNNHMDRCFFWNFKDMFQTWWEPWLKNLSSIAIKLKQQSSHNN